MNACSGGCKDGLGDVDDDFGLDVVEIIFGDEVGWIGIIEYTVAKKWNLVGYLTPYDIDGSPPTKIHDIEIADMDGNRIGIGAAIPDIQRRNQIIPDNLPALAGINQLAKIIGVSIFFPAEYKGPPDINRIRLIYKGIIRIGITGAQFPRR